MNMDEFPFPSVQLACLVFMMFQWKPQEHTCEYEDICHKLHWYTLFFLSGRPCFQPSVNKRLQMPFYKIKPFGRHLQN